MTGTTSRPKLADLLYVGQLLIVAWWVSKEIQVREPTCFVLASLLDGPLHGDAIVQRAEHLSGGQVKAARLATDRGCQLMAGGPARQARPA
jgi:hypothetical protein